MGSVAYATEHILINNVFFWEGQIFALLQQIKLEFYFQFIVNSPQKC
jgi:hypothetical protein